MDCKYLLTAETCTGTKSGYKCAWHTDKCEAHTYTCGEISQDDCGEKMYGFDCMW